MLQEGKHRRASGTICILAGFFLCLLFTYTDAGGKKAIPPSSVPFIVYHYIFPDQDELMGVELDDYLRISPTDFEKHLNYLKNQGFNSLTVDEYLKSRTTLRGQPEADLSLPSSNALQVCKASHCENNVSSFKLVVLTFDDGTRDHYKYVFPLLKRFGMKGTFFINPQNVGDGPKFMTWNNLREMVKAGMQVGNHSMTHGYKANARPIGLIQRRRESNATWKRRLKLEVDKAEDEFEKHLGFKTQVFGLPFGWYTRSLIQRIEERKYPAILTVDDGVNNVNTPTSLLKRQTIFREDTFDDFVRKVNEKHLEISNRYPKPGEIVKGRLNKISFKISGVEHLSSGKIAVSVNHEEIPVKISNQISMIVEADSRSVKKGFKMITVVYTDNNNVRYVNSWSFLFRPN